MNLDGRTRVAVVVLRTGLSGSLAVQRGISDCAKGFTSQLEEVVEVRMSFSSPLRRWKDEGIHKVTFRKFGALFHPIVGMFGVFGTSMFGRVRVTTLSYVSMLR